MVKAHLEMLQKLKIGNRMQIYVGRNPAPPR